jgi:hypothetical protein
MNFPSRLDINTHIPMLQRVVRDPILRSGVLQTRRGSADPLSYNGGFSIVYKVLSSGRAYGLKCWTQDIGEAAQRYDSITRHLSNNAASYLMDFSFLNDGITIDGTAYPILRMDWVEGAPLQEFVNESVRLNDQQGLSCLAGAFREMCRLMACCNIAHGDLQGPNVIVRAETSGKSEVVLIDYDAMVVPSTVGFPVTTGGNPHYQHPKRGAATASSLCDDHFSQLVIYLSILAISKDLSLWRKYYKDDEALLFRMDDFTHQIPTEIFRDLRSGTGAVSRLALALWNYSRYADPGCLPSLETITVAAEGAHQISDSSSGGTRFDDLLKSKVGSRPMCAADAWFDESEFSQAALRTSGIKKDAKTIFVDPVSPGGKSSQGTVADFMVANSATQIHRTTHRANASPPAAIQMKPTGISPISARDAYLKTASFHIILISYLVLIASYIALIAQVALNADSEVVGEEPLLLLFLISLLWLFIYGAIVLHRAWRPLQGTTARVTPGMALGLLFVPLYSYYWIFQSLYGWAKDYNAFLRARGIDSADKRASENLFLLTCIGSVSFAPLSFMVPVSSIFLIIIVPVLWIICLSQMIRGLNYLVHYHTTNRVIP